MTAIEKIKADPRVKGVSDERDSGDGYWVYLSGWHTYDNVHVIHEETPTKCLRELKYIVRCDGGPGCSHEK